MESDIKRLAMLAVAAAAASGCRYNRCNKADVESGAVVEMGNIR